MPSHYCVIDFETTGCSPESDRVVEVAAVRVDQEFRELERWDSLVDPGCHVGATHVHGITNEMVDGAPRFEELLVPLTRLLDGAVLVAHNFPFDRGFLVGECTRLGIHFGARGATPTRLVPPGEPDPSLPRTRTVRRMTSRDPRVVAERLVRGVSGDLDEPRLVLDVDERRPTRRPPAPRVALRETDVRAVRGVCTVQLARRTPEPGSRSLAACCRLFGIERSYAHAALDDALATTELLRRLRDRGVLPDETPPLAFLDRVPLLALTAPAAPRRARHA